METDREKLLKYLLSYPRNAYTIADYYLSYIDYIEKNTVYDVDFKVFKKIINDYFKYLRDEVIERSRKIKLPCRLGTIEIIKKKPKTFTSKSLAIDFRETRLLGKLMYHLNEHSDYYKYRVHWSKIESLVTNKTKYLFVLSRANKRRLALIIKNKEHDYTEIM